MDNGNQLALPNSKAKGLKLRASKKIAEIYAAPKPIDDEPKPMCWFCAKRVVEHCVNGYFICWYKRCCDKAVK